MSLAKLYQKQYFKIDLNFYIPVTKKSNEETTFIVTEKNATYQRKKSNSEYARPRCKIKTMKHD